MKRATATAGTALLVLLLAACGQGDVAAPAMTFAPRTDTSLKDPDNPAKVFRIDFARVEQEYPLSRAQLAGLTPEKLAAFTQEEVDQIYGRLTAGTLPDGAYRSAIFFPRGDSLHGRIEELVGGVRGRLAADAANAIEIAINTLWKGKTFDRSERIARTFVEDIAPLRSLIDDPDTLTTTTLPRSGPLSLILAGTKVWTLFPAKVFCGQSLLDGRRKLIVIDYSYNEDIEGYRARPDGLVGREGLALRDEIRMVRPGFYLGRAYLGRMFLLNFTLYDEGVAASALPDFTTGRPTAEDCWIGEQARGTTVR